MEPFKDVSPGTPKAIIPQLRNTFAEKPWWFTSKTSMKQKKGCGIIHVHWKLGIMEKMYCGR